MALFGSVTVLHFIGLGLLGVGLLLHIIGLATPCWSVTPLGTLGVKCFGLWKDCIGSKCYASADSQPEDSDKVRASEAFALLGMFMAIAALGLGIFHLVLKLQGRSVKTLIPVGIAAASGTALLFIIICAIIWGAGVQDESLHVLGYSFTLSLVGGFYVAIGGAQVFLVSRVDVVSSHSTA